MLKKQPINTNTVQKPRLDGRRQQFKQKQKLVRAPQYQYARERYKRAVVGTYIPFRMTCNERILGTYPWCLRTHEKGSYCCKKRNKEGSRENENLRT